MYVKVYFDIDVNEFPNGAEGRVTRFVYSSFRDYLIYKKLYRIPFVHISSSMYVGLMNYLPDMICWNRVLREFIRLWRRKRQRDYKVHVYAKKNYVRFLPFREGLFKKMEYMKYQD